MSQNVIQSIGSKHSHKATRFDLGRSSDPLSAEGLFKFASPIYHMIPLHLNQMSVKIGENQDPKTSGFYRWFDLWFCLQTGRFFSPGTWDVRLDEKISRFQVPWMGAGDLVTLGGKQWTKSASFWSFWLAKTPLKSTRLRELDCSW